jgi:phosphatidylglycerophosphate synthase
MSILKEYKSSLKSFDVEEIIDLIIFRPLSFLLVKIIYSTNITPNQISIISMFFGLLAGVIIGFGKYEFVLAGAVLIFLSNLLDCADGQLARLKKNGTKIGRLIDGFIDYVTGLSAFLGLGFAVSYITGDYV